MTLDGVVEAPEKRNPPYYDDGQASPTYPRLSHRVSQMPL